MKYLIYLFSFFLIACSSSSDISSSVNSVELNIFKVFDVTKQDDQTYTFSWLTRSESEPLTLVQFTLKEDRRISQEYYQWFDGDKKFRLIDISAEKDAIPQYIQAEALEENTKLNIDLRFGEYGAVVFQKIFFNNRYHQFSDETLQYIGSRVNKRVERLKRRNRGSYRTLQGIWQYGVFIDCIEYKEHDVEFLDHVVIPNDAFLVIRAHVDHPLLFGDIDLEEAEVIWQAPIDQKCFQIPK